MFKSILAAILIVTGSLAATAQDDRLSSLNFDEEPLPEETTPYAAVGVGPVLNLYMPDVADVNAKAASLGLGNLSSPLLMFGAEIYTAVGIVPNVRLGFSWLSGSVGTAADVAVGANTLRRSLDYHVSTRTIHIDYALTASKAFTILPGVGLCWGNTMIDVRQNDSNVDWNGIIDTSTSGNNTSLTQSSLVALPRVSFEYVLTPFLAIRAQGAYAVQFSTSEWQANGYSTVANMPSSVS
ncbi:MAG: hypothetical protein ACK45E_01700, partial [Ignavibacteria bacterium]